MNACLPGCCWLKFLLIEVVAGEGCCWLGIIARVSGFCEPSFELLAV